jgi:hypothetical protein
MDAMKLYLLRVKEEWNGVKMRELDIIEQMDAIKKYYEMGIISVEEFTKQNIELLINLKKNLI